MVTGSVLNSASNPLAPPKSTTQLLPRVATRTKDPAALIRSAFAYPLGARPLAAAAFHCALLLSYPGPIRCRHLGAAARMPPTLQTEEPHEREVDRRASAAGRQGHASAGGQQRGARICWWSAKRGTHQQVVSKEGHASAGGQSKRGTHQLVVSKERHASAGGWSRGQESAGG